MNRSIAILGRGRLAIAALREAVAAGYSIVRVVVDDEPEWDVKVSTYARAMYPSVELDMSGDWRHLIGVDVDVILSVGYTRIIGQPLLDGPARVLNLHLGKLPEYRGMRPINWALRNGESTAGVTLHEIDPGVDTGPIVAQSTFSIWPDVDEVKDVWLRAVHAGERILHDVLPILGRLKAVPQDESRARYYSAADIPQLGDRADWYRP